MTVIALAGEKGGAGKSTLCVHLAVEAVRRGLSVAILDADPQASIEKWSDRRNLPNLPHVVSAKADRIEQALKSVQEYDVVLIDTAGKASGETLAVVRRADLTLLPLRPSVLDIETLTKVVDILTLAKAEKKAFVVLNSMQSGPGSDSRVTAARELVQDAGLAVAPVALGQRVLFADALIVGKAAGEIDATSKAADEITRLYDWIEGGCNV